MSEIKCPKCGSNQIHSNKKGFSTGKAVAGTLVGGVLIGAAVGGIGSDKIEITCLNCGHKFKPGEQLKEKTEAIVEKHFDDGYVKPIRSSLVENIGRYKCHHCERIATAKGYCPSCGTPYNESDLYYEDLKSAKGGCLGVLIILLIPIGLIITHFF
jgi:RNA polymerase subunit RPABC4/transcription elongation factor Spt4